MKEHPRVCGENNPPVNVHMDIVWNIPAYAGKTTRWLWGPPAATEHPRVCGENRAKIAQMYAQGGTSPRMRGKQVPDFAVPKVGRNIPAYAGKTMAAIQKARASQEHPRVCGENTY